MSDMCAYCLSQRSTSDFCSCSPDEKHKYTIGGPSHFTDKFKCIHCNSGATVGSKFSCYASPHKCHEYTRA